jgi:hypothetical protein
VKKLDQAISEIAAVQEKEVDLFKQTMEIVKAEDIEKDIEHSYHKAVDLKDKVAEANTEIQEAIENDQEFIEIDIVTEKDKSHDSGGHHEKHEKKKDTTHVTPKKNANLERIEQHKRDDAKEREANRKRIKLIEKGRKAQKAQKMKNKLSKNNQKDKHT